MNLKQKNKIFATKALRHEVYTKKKSIWLKNNINPYMYYFVKPLCLSAFVALHF